MLRLVESQLAAVPWPVHDDIRAPHKFDLPLQACCAGAASRRRGTYQLRVVSSFGDPQVRATHTTPNGYRNASKSLPKMSRHNHQESNFGAHVLMA